jgi:hypothetical protein
MRHSKSIALATAVALAVSTLANAGTAQPRGALQFFTDEAAFDAALGVPSNLTIENFDGGANVGPFPTLCGEPMGSTSNDPCFTPGQLQPGFGITSTSGDGIIIFPSGFLGPNAPTRQVGATDFADATIISFAPSISAAAADVYGGLSPNPVDVEVFDESGNSLGTTVLPAVAARDTSTFFGVISPVAIGKITVSAENAGGELIDNLQFRAAGLLPPGLLAAFVPDAIVADGTSTLTITLGNQGQPGDATLTAELVDTLPDGVVVAAASNAATTCTNGNVTASGSTIALASGTAIPGGGTCTVTVDVTAAAPGLYTNTIAAGALVTDAGTNADPANASLKVTSGATGTFPPGENFDEAPIPSLPAGWTSSTTTGGNDFTTTISYSDTAPNAAFAPDRPIDGDFTLDSPVFTPVARQTVTFRHKVNLERRNDGAVLEISINGGAFEDITEAGGSFVSGGYGYTMVATSPLAGRYAWTGDSGGFMTTIAVLPAAATGQPTQLRFRTADDSSVAPDGDAGWWIDSIMLGVEAVPPSASFAPASLDFSVDPDATATQSLTLSNAAGSDSLSYNVESRGAAAHRPTLIPYASFAKATTSSISKALAPREPATFAMRPLGSQHAPAPWAPEGSLLMQWDDGSAETALGAGTQGPPATEQASVYLNRFSASDALVIHEVSVYWPVGDGDLTGLQANLVVYYDADGDGDPTNAVRVGTDLLVPVSVTGNFQTYQTNFSIPGGGDVYVGFVDEWAIAGGFTPRLFPAALDEDASAGMSYISFASTPPVDIVNLGNNTGTGTIFDVEQGSLDGNFMIRAAATGGGEGGPCSGPAVNWLSATPVSGSIVGGADTTLQVTVNPSAGGLVPGVYTADLCITTNDPAHALLSVPVSVTVGTPPRQACDGGPDELFCTGFEATGGGGGAIVSGTIDQAVVEDANGSSWDFVTQSFHGYDPGITSDDINLYELVGGPEGDGMYVYWYGDVVPPEFTDLVGGVVDASGVDFAVLHSGDSIGPDAVVSAGSTLMASWIGGSDGYVGIAFYNESTHAVNYGYLHMTTAGPLGFPAEVHDWAYDSSGAAITIP